MDERIMPLPELLERQQKLKAAGKKIVFTNGVFDILHRGHLEYLQKAKDLGDVLLVAVNSDASVRRLKGEKRPIVCEADRAFLVSMLKPVDFVLIFEEDTPEYLIETLQPDVLVKGADYQIHEIVGSDSVQKRGGEVARIPLTQGKATTGVVETIIARYGGQEKEL